MATIIQTSASLAAALARDVLALARPRAPMVQRSRVNDSVIEIRPLLERLLGEDITLVVDLAPEAGEAMVDPKRLEHALLNLVVNSRDALPDGGRITISTRATEDRGRPSVVLAVADTGGGMASVVRERAFESFFTTKAESGGLGLGLSSVQRFAAESRADVAIDSELHRGTTVSIRLDRLPVSNEGEEPRAPGPAAEVGGDGEVILVADPDEHVREAIRLVLDHERYRVVLAATQESALERAAAEPVRVAIIDDRLLRSDPRTFFHRLRALRSDVRLIVMSDATSREGAPMAVTLLAKAFSGEDLLKSVRRALGVVSDG